MRATKKRFNQLTAWVLTLAMLMTFIPSLSLTAFADTYNYYDENNNSCKSDSDAELVRRDDERTEFTTGWYKLENAKYDNRITINGDVKFILYGTSSFNAGITVPVGSSLTIYKSMKDERYSRIEVTSADSHASAIGGGWDYNVGDIIINGGYVYAPQGIGAGEWGSFNNVTINGGTVIATNGIGGVFDLFNSTCQEKVEINGGNITANDIQGDAITINGGTISTNFIIARNNGTITIDGGCVKASSLSKDAYNSKGDLLSLKTYKVTSGFNIAETVIKDDTGNDYQYGIKDAAPIDNNLYFYLPENVNADIHIHPICGAEHSDIGDHTGACGDVIWKAVSTEADLKAMTSGGSYYLANDIELTSLLFVSNINLCLNGFELKQTAEDRVIQTNEGITLNICDCSENQTGSVTGGHDNDGAGIYSTGVSSNTTVNIYGGTISRCKKGAGLGIAYSGATANIYGGKITGNNGGYGGVYCYFGATLNMYGGEISGNTADYAGGGVWLHESTLNISGDVNISGNTLNGSPNNLHIEADDENPPVVNIGALSNASKIGVTIGETGYREVNSGEYEQYAEFLTGAVSASGASYIDNFFSDVDKYIMAADGEGLKLVEKPALLIFNANGGSGEMAAVTSETGEYTLPECEFTAPENKTFYGWATSADGEVIKSKTYTVTQDTTFYAVWGDITEVKYTTDGGESWSFDSLMNAIWKYGADVEIKLLKDIELTSENWSYAPVFVNKNSKMTIDGQGHKIIRGNGANVFATVGQENSTLTLKNIIIDGGAVWNGSNPATRTNSGYSTSNYYYLFDVYNGILILDEGAVIQNAHLTNENSYGGAVAVSQTGALVMNEGSEIKNCTAGSGGAVCIVNSTAGFIMNGGKITGCYATSGGGAVLAQGTFIMNGGEISGNASGNNGGGVTVSTNGVFTLVDGAVKNNASVAGGGAVTILAANAILNLKGGEISGNTITGSLGGGILVNNGIFNLSGAHVIKDNLSGTKASNVYLGTSKVINISDVLSNTTKIGITMKSLSVFTSGWNTYMNGKDKNNYFVSDAADSYIAINGTELALTKNISFTVTDTEQIYTGEPKNITFSVSDSTLKTDEFAVKYYRVNENEGKLQSITAVTNAVEAGKYLYVITFTDNSKGDFYIITNKLDKSLDTDSAVSKFTGYGNTGIFTIKTGITGQQTPIYFKDGTVNLKVGGEFTNELTNGNGTTPTFTSSNEAVAKVDSTGKVTAIGKGTATITAKSEKDETTPVYASYTVNVDFATKILTADNFTVIAKDKTYDGAKDVVISATVKSEALYAGDNIRVDITGEFADGNAGDNKTVNYKITGISGTGAENYVLENGTVEGTAAAKIEKANVTIICAATTTRTFDGNPQSVDVSAMANGAVFDSSNYTVKYNGGEAPSAVGSYPVTIELTAEAEQNYTVTQPSATLIIKDAAQEVFSVEGVPEAVYYGDSFTLSAEGASGTVTYAITSGTEFAEISGADVTVKGVGKVTITATSVKDGHANRTATKSFNAKQRILIPTVTATNRTYNGENGVEVAVSLKNIVDSDDITATATGSMINADAGNDKLVYVSGITLDGAKKDLYTLDTTSVQTTVDISKKEITGFEISADSRKYDTTSNAATTVTEISGVLEADKGQVEVIGKAAFDTADSGTGKTVTFTASGLSGAKAANYTLTATEATATADITPLSVDFVVGNKAFVYDGSNKEISVSATDENGKIFKDFEIEYSETPNAVGEYTANVVLQDDTNYTTTQGDITVTISEATQDNLVIVGLPGTIQYGDSFTLEAVGGEDGGTYEWNVKDNADVTLSATDTAETIVTIGEVVGQKVEIEVVKKTENYEDISAKVVFVPTAKVVTFDISNLEQTYGEVTDVTITPSDTKVSEDDYTITYNGGELPENAGTYTVKVETKDESNYSGIQTATLTIKKATATGTITGINSTYTYGDVIDTENVGVTDLLDGTTATIKYAGTGIYVPQNTPPTKVGNYTVIAEITGDNYETLTVTKNFVIEKATLTVKADDATREYGEANPIFTLSYTGFVNGETKDVLLAEPIATVNANASSGVREYDIKVSGGSAENYKFIYDNTGKLAVTSAAGSLYITGSTNTVYVNDIFGLHAFYGNSKVNVTWESSDSTIAEIAANGTVTAKKAGTVTIKATADANYGNATATFELTVKQTGITLVPTGLVKTYTGERQDISFVPNADFTPVLSGEDKNVDVTYTLISNPSVTEPIQAGTYSVVYTISDGSYTGGGNTTMYINKAEIEVKPKNITKVYGDEPVYELETESTLISANELTTLAENTTFTSEGKAKTAVVKDDGYEITATLNTTENKNLKFVVNGTGTLTVAKAPLTVKVKDVTREYGSENPMLEAEYTGFKNEETENTENIFTGELVLAYDESINAETAVGEYVDKTTAAGIEAANYEITFVPGNVKITKIGVTASAGTSRSSYLTVKFDKAIAGLGVTNFDVKNGEETITITEVTASSDNKTYTLKGSFSTSVTYTVTPNLTGGTSEATHEITSEPLSIKPSSSGGGGGGGGSSAPTTYTVKFETDGGSEIDSVKVTKNKTIDEPAAPTKDGYIFGGWYTDEELTKAYDFETKVTKSFTLYAKWDKHDDEADKPGTSDKECDGTATDDCPSLTFDDLDVKAWYHLDTDYVIENGIFKGVSETEFAPNDILTRAMLVTVLYRVEGEPATNRSIPFADVDMGAYYGNAVSWAKQNGIVNGVSETEFAPNDNITREQIAAIMHRYAQYKGYDVSVGENTNILSYDDFDSISEYAIASMQYACGSGLIKGKSESTLNPLDNATRAEIAAILHRFIEANK